MYKQEHKKITPLSIILWGIALTVFAIGTQNLWSSLHLHAPSFIGKTQPQLEPDLLLVITEGMLLDAQFLCLLSVYTFLWVTATGKISTVGVAASTIGAHLTNTHFADIYYFAEFVLPYIFIAAVLITPTLMAAKIIPKNPSRIIALGAAGAIITIISLFHIVLISGLQNHLKEASRQSVLEASKSSPETLQSACRIMKLECQIIEDGRDYENGNLMLQKGVRDVLSQTQNIQQSIVTGFDITEKHLSDLPAAKDEVFVAVTPTQGGRIIAIDLENYPTLRKKLAFYITVLSMAAITAWQTMSIGLMFFHQRRKKRRGGFE